MENYVKTKSIFHKGDSKLWIFIKYVIKVTKILAFITNIKDNSLKRKVFIKDTIKEIQQLIQYKIIFTILHH
jgi:hypothetical protein